MTPACVGQQGVIRCECADWDFADRMKCVTNRTRWLHAASIANAPGNDARKRIINAFPEREQPEIRRIAWQMIQERT